MTSSNRVLNTEGAISSVLRLGVLLSLIFMVTGSLLSFFRPGGYGRKPAEVVRLIGSEGAFPRTLAWLVGGLRHGNGQAVIVVGLLILIATPVIRVAVSLLAFARERDRPYIVITGLVLLLLIISFALGRVG